jgi:hypothetical protein
MKREPRIRHRLRYELNDSDVYSGWNVAHKTNFWFSGMKLFSHSDSIHLLLIYVTCSSIP